MPVAAMKDSPILNLLVNKWPLSGTIQKKWKGFDTTDWNAGKRLKWSCVCPCIRHNPEGKKTHKWISDTCKCGAILASIAKGLHEKGNNQHLKLEALLPCLPPLDAFREMIQKKEGSLTTKELLCFFFRTFVITMVEGSNNSKYAIIGTNQRCALQNLTAWGVKWGSCLYAQMSCDSYLVNEMILGPV
jgi:hypothetical protein